MERFSKIAGGLCAAALLSYGSNAAALAEGYAEAALNLSNVLILGGDGAQGTTGGPLGAGITLTLTDSNGGSNADMNGDSELQDIEGLPAGTAFAIYTEGGSGYAPNTHILAGFGPTSFAGGTSSTYGNLLVPLPTAYPPVVAPGSDTFDTNDVNGGVNVYAVGSSACAAANVGDCVYVQSQVNLANAGDGSANADQGVQTNFALDVGVAGWLEMSFDAEGFLRTALGDALLSADAGYDWEIVVEENVVGPDATIFTWAPDGVHANDTDGVGGDCTTTNVSGLGQDCYEYDDPFSMNEDIDVLGGPDFDIVNNLAGGHFEAELFLTAGSYNLSIVHTTRANAVTVPEPGTLALLGLGILGVGAARRRKG